MHGDLVFAPLGGEVLPECRPESVWGEGFPVGWGDGVRVGAVSDTPQPEDSFPAKDVARQKTSGSRLAVLEFLVD